MSNPKNDLHLLSLHPAAVAGSILGARPLRAHAAAEDAEPETAEPPRELRRPRLTGPTAGPPPAPKAGRA